MSAAKHTPGPWVRVRGELVGSNGVKVIEYASGVAIMCGAGDNAEHVANAELRNAAPDLLEAAVALVDAADEFECDVADRDGSENNNHLLAAIATARAAIAKATGEAS